MTVYDNDRVGQSPSVGATATPSPTPSATEVSSRRNDGEPGRGWVRVPASQRDPTQDNETRSFLLIDSGNDPWQPILPGDSHDKEVYQLIAEMEGSDPATTNKLQDLVYSVDKSLWQLRAHLQRPSSRRGDLPWVGHQTR
jgi:hypothetical protein